MGMAPYQFSHQPINNAVQIKDAFFIAHLPIKNHLKQ